jgi:hypothetical protein
MKCPTSLMIVAAVMALMAGCTPSQPPPKLDAANWQPKSIAGPIEVKPLPPSHTILADYRKWIETDSTGKKILTSPSGTRRKIGELLSTLNQFCNRS